MNYNYNIGMNYIKSCEIYYRDKSNENHNEKIADCLKEVYNFIVNKNKLSNSEKQILANVLVTAAVFEMKK